MKILMVVDHKIPTDIRIENEAEILVRNGHQVGILSVGDYQNSEEVMYNGFTLYRIAMSKFWLKKMHGLAGMISWMDRYLEKQISKILLKDSYQVIHLHDLYTFGVISRLKKKFNLLYIGDMHENYVEVIKDYNWPNRFPNNMFISHKKWERKEKEWLAECDKVITVSKGIIDRLIEKGVKRENTILTPNSIRLDLFDSFSVDDSVLDRFTGKYTLLYVGGFISNRGLDHVIKGMEKLSKSIPNVHLILVGDGEESAKLRELVGELGIENLVSFEGWKKQSEIKSYLQIADVGLVPFKKTPQTDNSSSNKLFQYMYYKLPIAATNCNSIQELVMQEQCGIIYESENTKAFSETILELRSNCKRSEEFGRNGYNAVVNKYNWEIAARDMLDMYRELEHKVN